MTELASFIAPLPEPLRKLAQYYQPLDTVDVLNQYITSRPGRLILNGVLFASTAIFLCIAGAELIKTLLHGRATKVNIIVYMFVLLVMLLTDVVAVGFEAREVSKARKVALHDVISIGLSAVIGVVTSIILRYEWCRYRTGKRAAEISVPLLVLKLMLYVMICVLSGKALYRLYKTPQAPAPAPAVPNSNGGAH